jgi:large conductance mechanosensitive channel
MGFISEFKDFAMKGNVMDMAVGVIIGGAFGKIVTSLVENVIMPIVSVATGGVNFAEKLAYKMGEGEGAAEVKLGAFLQSAFDFVIIAFCIFIMIKMVNKARLAIEGEPEPEVKEDPADIHLLREIRDSLKKG